MNSDVFNNGIQLLSITKALSLAIRVLLLTSVVVTAANGTIPSLLVHQSQQQAFAQQASSETGLGSVLKLARPNVPIDMPLLKGYENGNEIYSITTHVSDE